jgi:RNA polymerase primary sigma factor/RNA polymerase nonessential primary-like sigma factor
MARRGGGITRQGEPRIPDEDYDLVGQYLRQIRATPLLTAAEEVELAKRIEAGVYAAEILRAVDSGERPLPAGTSRDELMAVADDGVLAKDRMIRANLRLVVSTARRYQNTGLSFLDLVQDGNLGLIRAVDKFDYRKGFKFSTYAVWWIRQAIERGRADKARGIRLPVHVLEEISRLGRADRKLQFSLGRGPTVKELADATGSTLERVDQLREISRSIVSLDTPIGDEGEASYGDLIEDTEVLQPSDVVEFRAMADELREIVKTLPPREALVITLRYGLHDGRQHTLAEIGERLGLTKERIRQIEKEAVEHLRDPARREPLLHWAG